MAAGSVAVHHNVCFVYVRMRRLLSSQSFAQYSSLTVHILPANNVCSLVATKVGGVHS